MGTFIFELRDAVRGLRRDRGFAIAVVLTLAVTIGATTAAFSIVDGVLLKPLAFPEPDRLVTLQEYWREVMKPGQAFPVNEQHFEHWRAHNESFDSMAQYITLPSNLTSGGPASQISVVRSSGTLFDVLGASPMMGRALRAADEPAGAADVVMLSEGLWRRRFGARSDIIGTSIVLDGKPFEVVGVFPATFRLPSGDQLLASVEAAIALRLTAGWVGDHNNLALGRLKPGVSIERARAEINLLQGQASEMATKQAGQSVTLSGIVTPLGEAIVNRSRRSLLMLFGSVLSVLLIACANLTNLALTRTLSHLRDAAVRAALGASRGRLVRQALLEQATLGAAGGLLGIWLASLALGVFVRTAPIDLPRVEEVAISGQVLAFGALITIITVLLVSALPIWHLARRDPQEVLRSGSAAAGQGPAAMRARATLTAMQVALSVTLLTVTALLGASLLRVLRIDYGFNADHVLSVPVAMAVARYADDTLRVTTHDRILESVKAIPGVRSVSSTSLLPMRGEGQVNFLLAAGTNVPRSEQPSANFRFIGPDYFAALQLPVLRGRSISLDDRAEGKPMPALISESVARRLWPDDDNALGKHFGRGITGEADFEVIGIVPDARTTSLERTPPLMVYVPYWWRSRPNITLLVKSNIDAVALASSIRRAIDQIDPDIAIGESRPLNALVDAALAGRRYQARLFIVFGVVALAIATLGVYAVAAYSVSKRRRELNIRVALGAATQDVMRLLMRQSARTILIGAAAGLAMALAAGRLTAGMLYEVQPRDPLILGIVVAVVSTAGMMASLLAARSGLAINPVAALREE
jgi:putative ABC transport system permease protein